ncbi:MAG TPA: hypothetical protein VNO21_00685 [Polyangiaceae bacterium]|nr:hypothetical protein [Polyangiaceae bacterium]
MTFAIPKQRTKLARWFAPPIADVLFVLILLLMVLGGAERLLIDADTGWHIRTGDYVLSQRRFIDHDIFSYSRYGQYWVAWEWLSDVLLSLANRFAGLLGVTLLSALVLAATFRKLLATLLARGNDRTTALLFTFLVFAASAIHVNARPHIVSWYLTLTLYVLLDDYQRGLIPAKRLIWAPVIMLFWVNLHGGFIMGFIITTLIALANLLDYLFASKPESLSRFRTICWTLLAMLAVSFCTPFGYRLHENVLKLLSNVTLMDAINEYQSMNFHTGAGKCFILVVLSCVIFPAYSKLRFTTHEAIVLAVCLAGGFVAVRAVPTSSMLSAIIIMPHLTRWMRDQTAPSPDGATGVPSRWQKLFRMLEESSKGNSELDAQHRSPVVACSAMALLVALVLNGGSLAGRPILDAAFPETRFLLPGARDFIRTHPEIDHLFAPDYFTGYVVYYFYPAVRCAMDTRFDLVGESYQRDYETVTSVLPGWDAVLERWKVDYVLFPHASTLAAALAERAEWKVLFEDSQTVLFHRAKTPNGAPSHRSNKRPQNVAEAESPKM